MKKKIAIMQPYFAPYAGYFRLFSTTDLFVIYDCVQFPRRGWLHRNKLPDRNNEGQWLTLPIKKCPQETLIKDLEFSDDAEDLWQEQVNQFPHLSSSDKPFAKEARKINSRPIDFISELLELACEELNIDFTVAYSSDLNIPQDVRGQDRILAIAKHFGATDYVNAPGGRELYDEQSFNEAGINLHFLSDYKGSNWSILHRLITEDPTKIREEIDANS